MVRTAPSTILSNGESDGGMTMHSPYIFTHLHPYPLIMSNIAIENTPFISIYNWFSYSKWWFSIAMGKITRGYSTPPDANTIPPRFPTGDFFAPRRVSSRCWPRWMPLTSPFRIPRWWLGWHIAIGGLRGVGAWEKTKDMNIWSPKMDEISPDLASGKHTKIAIDNGPVEIVDLPIAWVDWMWFSNFSIVLGQFTRGVSDRYWNSHGDFWNLAGSRSSTSKALLTSAIWQPLWLQVALTGKLDSSLLWKTH